MQNKFEKLFEYDRLSTEDILKIDNIGKIITQIIDYYSMSAPQYENKYYMEITAPISIKNLTIPGPVVELHSGVRSVLENKK